MDDLDIGATLKGFTPGQQVFGRYSLVKVLGRGGMGVVWLARDEKLERDIALKFLPEVVAHDPEAVRDLKRETRRSLELTHPHIVRIYDFVQDARHAAIAMEYVAGATLAARKVEQSRGCFEVAEIREWVRHLLDAVAYAHGRAQVVHRDIKPANLMLDAQGFLKVADFGIAASVSDSVSRVSVQAGSSGTPVYMSPQQMMGEKPAVSDDIYALGATLFDLLTGKPPFYSGNVVVQVQNKVPPSLAERRADLGVAGEGIPAEWEAAIAACLAKDPAERPRDAVDLSARLGMTVEQPAAALATPRPTVAASSRPPVSHTASGPALSSAGGSTGASPRRPHRPLLLAVTAVVIVLGAGGWWIGQQRAEAARVLAAQQQAAAEAAAEQARLAAEELARQQALAEERRRREEGLRRQLVEAQTAWERVQGRLDRTEQEVASWRLRVVQERPTEAGRRHELTARADLAVRFQRWQQDAVNQAGLPALRARVEAQLQAGQLDEATAHLTLYREGLSALGRELDQRSLQDDAALFGEVRVRVHGVATPWVVIDYFGVEHPGENTGTVNRVAAGEGVLESRKPGWPVVRQTIRVAAQSITEAQLELLPGRVQLTANVAAATVLENGRVLGTVPLLVENLAPGPRRYELAAEGYLTTPVEGLVTMGETLELPATLERRIPTQDELLAALWAEHAGTFNARIGGVNATMTVTAGSRTVRYRGRYFGVSAEVVYTIESIDPATGRITLTQSTLMAVGLDGSRSYPGAWMSVSGRTLRTGPLNDDSVVHVYTR